MWTSTASRLSSNHDVGQPTVDHEGHSVIITPGLKSNPELVKTLQIPNADMRALYTTACTNST